jgi:lipoyl synthase
VGRLGWYQQITRIEPFDDAPLDADLVAAFERGAAAHEPRRSVRFYTPTFKSYETSELKDCGKNSFPAFSITGGACALDCDHCRAKILQPMIPATNPEMLDSRVRDLIMLQDLKGFLLSGGSNRRNEVPYERYLPTVEKLKHDYPHLRIAVHSALLDQARAKGLEAAGVDVAMTDVIGAQETIREVYHLERSVDDFEATLAALRTTRMEIVPHIVIGLHYGTLKGEFNALDMISRHAVDALVLVIVMPYYAAPETPFDTIAPGEIAQVFRAARQRLPALPLLLGCARPPGLHKLAVDSYALMAGLDGIAFPAEGIKGVADILGRPVSQEHACCSMAVDGALQAGRAA